MQARQQLGDSIQGKKQYENHVHEEMQNVSRNHQQLEMHADNVMLEHRHRQCLAALAEAKRQE